MQSSWMNDEKEIVNFFSTPDLSHTISVDCQSVIQVRLDRFYSHTPDPVITNKSHSRGPAATCTAACTPCSCSDRKRDYNDGLAKYSAISTSCGHDEMAAGKKKKKFQFLACELTKNILIHNAFRRGYKL